MKKIAKPCLPAEEKYILTEGINYFDINEESIWGPGDEDTLKVLKDFKFKGKWLHLAAGDGRYNNLLLESADKVLATDIDAGAISKLWHVTPQKLRKNLEIEVVDMTKRLPYEDKSFDGVFCVGTLHLLPKQIIKRSIKEMDRVLKKAGTMVIDFATDVKRVSESGKTLKHFKTEPDYTYKDIESFLKEQFKNYKINMYEGFAKEKFDAKGEAYEFSCRFILLIGIKN